MKAVLKRIFLVLFLAGLMVLPNRLSPARADTGLPENLWLSCVPCKDGDPMPSCSVLWLKQKKNSYILFMPGAADLGDARIWFSGTDEILIHDKTYRSGDRIEGITANTTLTLPYGKTEYEILIMQGSAISSAFVETASGSMKAIDKSTKYKEEGGRFAFLNPDGSIIYDGNMAHFKLRGNTSAELDKKNYGFKLAKGANLAKMGKAKRWVLIGNCRDLTLLRNQICLNMANYAGLPYTPDSAPVDLYLNHQYHGCYLLTEKIEVNDNRVDIYDLEKANEEANPESLESYPRVGEINKYKRGKYKAFDLPNNPADITGGYILEYENYQLRYGSELCAYNTMRSKIFLFKEPEIVSVEEMEYAISFIQGYEDAIFASDGRNPKTGKHYGEYVDFNSLVLKFMLEEISMNTDGNGSSQYYYKPSDSVSTVFFAGPAWDYDATLASFSAREFQNSFLDPERLHLTNVNKSNYYWPQLYAKDDFKAAVMEKWTQIYAPAMRILTELEKDPEGRLLSMKEYASRIAESAKMNFIRWPILWKNNAKRTGLTWEDNLSFLQNILEKRYEALQGFWGQAEVSE